MRKLQKQGKVPEGEGPQREKKVIPSPVKFIPIIIIMFIAFKMFGPQTNFMLDTDQGKVDKALQSDGSFPRIRDHIIITNKDKANYFLQATKPTFYKTMAIASKLSNHNNNIEEYQTDDILIDLNELRELVEGIEANDRIFGSLYLAYNEQLLIFEELLMNINNPMFYQNALIERLNEISQDIYNGNIKLLEDNNMHYKILEDGTIRYWY